MNKFFTADTHFGSERTRELSKRPFATIEEMDKTFINNWNNVVGKADIVYHIGDFGEYKHLKELNGKIILILGNYEKKEMKEKFNNNFAQYKNYLISLGFYEVYENNLQINIKSRTINLTHEPLDCVKNMMNLFGHIHKLQLVKSFGLNVGIDGHNFTPLDECDVEFYLNAIKNHYDENVFCTVTDINNESEITLI